MLSREDILAQARKNEITPRQAMEMIRELEVSPPEPEADTATATAVAEEPKKPSVPKPRPKKGHPEFRVAVNSGWCSIYFFGLRRPVTIPSVLCHELLDNLDQFRQFLEGHKEDFRNKDIQEKIDGTP
jgi:hypothetical protein